MVVQGPCACHLFVQRRDDVHRLLQHGGQTEAALRIDGGVEECLLRLYEGLELGLHLLRQRRKGAAAADDEPVLLGTQMFGGGAGVLKEGKEADIEPRAVGGDVIHDGAERAPQHAQNM